jgi:hypothetical protein
MERLFHRDLDDETGRRQPGARVPGLRLAGEATGRRGLSRPTAGGSMVIVVRSEDGLRRDSRATPVELEQREIHECVALHVRALTEELPRLVRRTVGCEPADRVVDVTERSE